VNLDNHLILKGDLQKFSDSVQLVIFSSPYKKISQNDGGKPQQTSHGVPRRVMQGGRILALSQPAHPRSNQIRASILARTAAIPKHRCQKALAQTRCRLNLGHQRGDGRHD
jgi:hypothetical protein